MVWRVATLLAVLATAVAPYSSRACWGQGFSRALCCGPPAGPGPAARRAACFGPGVGEDFDEEACCGTPYDLCFLAFVQEASTWNARPCSEYAEAAASWLSRDCLTWRHGDRDFERAAAADLLESSLARCFHVAVEAEESSASSPSPSGGAPSRKRHGFGVCAPTTCSWQDVVSDLHAFIDLPRLTLYALSRESDMTITVRELAPWRMLGERLDFVIAGFVNSGTSSLGKTLAAHPEVSMPEGEVDIPQAERLTAVGDGWSGDWRAWLCADLLPKEWIEENFPLAADSDSRPRRLRGFRNPLLLYSDDCLRGLSRARPMPKMLVAVRDPVEWLLSIFRHNLTNLGHGLHDWVPPSTTAGSYGTWFGRDHALVGSRLEALLAKWPAEKVLAVELEYLRHGPTAAVSLDAACRFLGITPFSELQLSSEDKRQWPLQYSRGLGSSSRSWGRAELCAPYIAMAVQSIAHGLQAEYRVLPALLARIGVRELGVSAALVAGGVFALHCSDELHLPGGRAGTSGQAERAAAEGRIRVTWRGEIGFEFQVRQGIRVHGLACGAGEGKAPREEVRVTLWDGVSKTPLWISVVGPGAPVWQSFAYGEAFPSPIALTADHTYAVTVQAAPGVGPVPARNAGADIPPDLGKFLRGVFSRGPWLYPSQHDEHAWEQAYLSIVTLHLAP